MKRVFTTLFLCLLAHQTMAKPSSNLCPLVFSLPAEREFKQLITKIDSGSGWQNLDVTELGSKHDQATQAIFKEGRKLALLIKDTSSPEGKRLVYGYLYDVRVTQKVIPNKDYVASLSPKKLKEYNQNIVDDSPDIPVEVRTLVITSTAPEYVDRSGNGLTDRDSAGWPDRPKKSKTVQVDPTSIIAAKVYYENMQ